MMDNPTIYCEWLSGAIHQPINTISSIVFLIVAVLLYRLIRKTGTQDWLLKLLPYSIALIGLSSAFWHYSVR